MLVNRSALGLPFPLMPPVLRNFPSGFIQPLAVRRQSNHFDGGEPFRGIGRRITERHQFAHVHQDLNVMLREAKEFRGGRRIEASWQPSSSPRCEHRILDILIHTLKETTPCLGRDRGRGYDRLPLLRSQYALHDFLSRHAGRGIITHTFDQV